MSKIDDFENSPTVKSLETKVKRYLLLFISFAFFGVLLILLSIFNFNLDSNLFYIGALFIFSSLPFVFLMNIEQKKYYSLRNEFISSSFENDSIGELLLTLPSQQTDPNALTWKQHKFITRMFFGNNERIRIRITKKNISKELTNILAYLKYDFENEPPEVIGLIKNLERISNKLDYDINIIKKTENTELKGAFVGYFEPYEFELPSKNYSLHLTITFPEFQWNLIRSKKEGDSSGLIDELKQYLLDSMKEYIRNGNRINPIDH